MQGMKAVKVKTRAGEIQGFETPQGVVAMVDTEGFFQVDFRYQRGYDDTWAEKISQMWKDTEARPVNTRLRNGWLFITNGQHTYRAAQKAGRKQILTIINTDTPASMKREAQEFVHFQKNVKRMTPYDQYHAALVQGDKSAKALKNVTDELGIIVAAKRDKDMPGLTLTAITPARRIAHEEGEKALKDVLEVCLAWDEDDKARFNYHVIDAVSKAINVNGKAKVLANAKRSTATKMWADATAKAGGRGGYVAISFLMSALGRKRPS